MIKNIKERFLVFLLVGVIVFTGVFNCHKNVTTVYAFPAVAPIVLTLAAVVGVTFVGSYYVQHREEILETLETCAEAAWNEAREALSGTPYELSTWPEFLAEVSLAGFINMAAYGTKLFLDNFSKALTYSGTFPNYSYMDYIDQYADQYPYYFVIAGSASSSWQVCMLSTPMSVEVRGDSYYTVVWGPADKSAKFGCLAAWGGPSGSSTFRIWPSGGGGVTYGALILASSVAISMPFLEDVVEDFMDNSGRADITQKVDDLDTTLADVVYGTTDSAGKFVEKIPVIDSSVWDGVASGDMSWSDVIADSGITVIDPATDTTIVGGNAAVDVPAVDGDKPVGTVFPEFPSWVPSGLRDIVVDLQRVFPFCIPFDIANLVSVLNVEPEAPRFKYTMRVDAFNYSYTFDVDLSKFDSVALVCRRVMLVLFVAGLAVVTRKLIRG